MKFDDVLETIGTLTELRRIEGAHVVDHNQLSNDKLREAIHKAKPQYLHEETVRSQLEMALYRDQRMDYRVLSRTILIEVLLDQYDFALPSSQTEEQVIAQEQSVLNESNEIEILDLACGDRESDRYHHLDLYSFVLGVAWEHENTKSPDEANLLRKLRDRLNIAERDHFLLEARLGRYPKMSNELHTRSEISDVRRYLQSMGLLFAIRQDDGLNVDLIPDELAWVMRRIRGLELRTDSYRELMISKRLRRKPHLTDVLTRSGVAFGRYDTLDTLVDRVVRYVPASKAIASTSPRYGLNSEELAIWCRELHLSPSGPIEDRVGRVIAHFDALRPSIIAQVDERARWYQFYEELACRSYEALRAQHVIEKDLEIETKFEESTRYLFADKLKHTPLQQRGSNHPDGLLSLQTNYLMWDNKSKEEPVNLKDHIRQFDAYMDAADKPVPVFLVVGPDFTEESESEAVRYHAQHFERNVTLITAKDLKNLAEEWSSEQNKKREEPFPLGLLAGTGKFDRAKLGKLI